MDKKTKNIYIASDHGGFELKSYLIQELRAGGYNVQELGPAVYDPSDDYSDYVKRVAEETSEFTNQNVGIVICKNGAGVSIAANKYKGIRCSLSWRPDHAKSVRNDDDTNFLALPANFIDNKTALQTTLAFLETPFSNEERHIRRIKKIENLGI